MSDRAAGWAILCIGIVFQVLALLPMSDSHKPADRACVIQVTGIVLCVVAMGQFSRR